MVGVNACVTVARRADAICDLVGSCVWVVCQNAAVPCDECFGELSGVVALLKSTDDIFFGDVAGRVTVAASESGLGSRAGADGRAVDREVEDAARCADRYRLGFTREDVGESAFGELPHGDPFEATVRPSGVMAQTVVLLLP